MIAVPHMQIVRPVLWPVYSLFSHLVKRASDGHLAKNPVGHLANQCPCPTIQVTFSDVDASVCTPCYDRAGALPGPAGDGVIFTSVVVDGTHDVPLGGLNGDGTLCLYEAEDDNAVNYDIYSTHSPCASLQGSSSFTRDIEIGLYLSDQSIFRVNSPGFFDSGSFSEGSKVFGDSLTNTLTCLGAGSLTSIFSDGGTAVVNAA